MLRWQHFVSMYVDMRLIYATCKMAAGGGCSKTGEKDGRAFHFSRVCGKSPIPDYARFEYVRLLVIVVETPQLLECDKRK